MEDFNLELLHKFNKFKTGNYSEQDRLNEDQEKKFKHYVSVSEELIRNLHTVALELKTQVKDLRNELVTLRTIKDDEVTDYQKQLVEEEQKVEMLKLRMKIEKERIGFLTNDMASLRLTKDEEIIKYKKLLMEEKQKNKDLSDKVERLQQQQGVLVSSRLKNTKEAQQCSTTAAGHVSQEITKHTKRTGGRKQNTYRA